MLAALLVLAGCEPQPRTLVTFVGDVLLDSKPGEMIRAGADPFGKVAGALGAADLVVANLECAVGNRGMAVEKEYTFRADPAAVAVLQRHVHLVSLANNHSGDYGDEALLDTMAHLRSARIGFFGAGENLSEAHRAFLVATRSATLGFLGYDEYQPRWFEAGVESAGVAWSEDELVLRDISEARRQGAEVVIPFMHWGWEQESAPTPRQRALARKMIDGGAEAVIGTHPHQTQGVEYYRGKLIVYSLGNFVFDLVDNEVERRGWLLRVELDREGVRRWATQLIRIDANGSPVLDRRAATPCGLRGRSRIEACKNGELPAR